MTHYQVNQPSEGSFYLNNRACIDKQRNLKCCPQRDISFVSSQITPLMCPG